MTYAASIQLTLEVFSGKRYVLEPSLHFTPGLQSSVCIFTLSLQFYPWSAVCVLHWPYLKLLDGNSTIDYISSVFFGFTLVFGHIIVLKRLESKRVSSFTLEKKFYRVNGNNYE